MAPKNNDDALMFARQGILASHTRSTAYTTQCICFSLPVTFDHVRKRMETEL